MAMVWVQANLPLVGFVVCALLLALVLLVGRGKRRERHRAADVLDEGAAPAQRNAALIEAPSAAARVSLGGEAVKVAELADTGPAIMGGIGGVIAAAAAHEVQAVETTGEVTEATAVAPAAPEPTETDDLTRIKGLGPKLKVRLAELGVVSFAQIAAWTEADIAAVDAKLGTFAGRSTRDQWVEQARFLASGDVAGYEAKFGKL